MATLCGVERERRQRGCCPTFGRRRGAAISVPKSESQPTLVRIHPDNIALTQTFASFLGPRVRDAKSMSEEDWVSLVDLTDRITVSQAKCLLAALQDMVHTREPPACLAGIVGSVDEIETFLRILVDNGRWMHALYEVIEEPDAQHRRFQRCLRISERERERMLHMRHQSSFRMHSQNTLHFRRLCEQSYMETQMALHHMLPRVFWDDPPATPTTVWYEIQTGDFPFVYRWGILYAARHIPCMRDCYDEELDRFSRCVQDVCIVILAHHDALAACRVLTNR